jgi:hypothetical protein
MAVTRKCMCLLSDTRTREARVCRNVSSFEPLIRKSSMKFVPPKDTSQSMARLGRASYSGGHISARRSDILKRFRSFSRPSRQMLGWYIKLGYDHFLPLYYRVIIVPLDAILSDLLIASLNNPLMIKYILCM